MKKYLPLLICGSLLFVGAGCTSSATTPTAPSQPSTPTAPTAPTSPSTTTNASYSCDGGKTIDATYAQGAAASAPSAGQPPTPTGSVALKLSDGRNLTLAQTISADGARYASTDGSIVFWNKGNGLTFTESNTETYTGCIEVTPDLGGLSEVYESGAKGFSLRYPTGYTVDDAYAYQALGPGKDIAGVKFTIPPSLATGTNLAADTYVSVEQIPQTQTCTADLFLEAGATIKTTDENGTTYSVGTLTDAGAGNRYEETVYALPGTNPCMAVRYFVHYGVLENYPTGTVQQFDEAALLKQFDAIRQTLVIAQ